MSFLVSFADAIGSIGKLVDPGQEERVSGQENDAASFCAENKLTLVTAEVVERKGGSGNLNSSSVAHVNDLVQGPRTPVLEGPPSCGSLVSQVSTVLPSPFLSPQSVTGLDPCPSPFKTPSKLGESGFLENFARNVALGLFSDLQAENAAQDQLKSAVCTAMNPRATPQRNVPPHLKGPISPVDVRTPTMAQQQGKLEAEMIPKIKPTLRLSPTFISPMKDAFTPVKEDDRVGKGKMPKTTLCKSVVSPIVFNAAGHTGWSVKKSQSLELWQIGMHISEEEVGNDSNFVWKVSVLTADKPAANSGQISVGDYLWSIENTCISMNFTSVLGVVSCLAQRKGEPGKWSIGVKSSIDAPTVSLTLVDPLQNVVAAANNRYGSSNKAPKVLPVKPATSSESTTTQEHKENMHNMLSCATPPRPSSSTSFADTQNSEAFARQLGMTNTKMQVMYEKLCTLDKFLQVHGDRNEKMSAAYREISEQYRDAHLAWYTHFVCAQYVVYVCVRTKTLPKYMRIQIRKVPTNISML